LVRSARWAGQFYTGDEGVLRDEVDRRLAEWPRGEEYPWAILVPHAGHVYSGDCAAAAYARVAGMAVDRVLLFGPNHHLPLAGFGLGRAEAWETPLGAVPVDMAAVEALLDQGEPFRLADAALELEHSLEVQLPFLQRVLPGVPFVPILVGHCDDEQRSKALDALAELRAPKELWVVTTDLSHFHDRVRAERLDSEAASIIEGGDPLAFREALEDGRVEACGATAVLMLLEAGRRRGGGIELLDRRDSSLASGDEEQVVGYLSAQLPREANRA